jgi:hypothetical protein
MANHGKVQLIYLIISPATHAEEGRRLFRSHGEWMKRTHHREGRKALVGYNVSTSPEPKNP